MAPLLKSKKSPRLDLDYISSSNVLILGGGGGFAALAGALQALRISVGLEIPGVGFVFCCFYF